MESATREDLRITDRERAAYDLQIRLGHAAFFAIGPAAVFFMRVVRANTFVGLEDVRRVYRDAARSGRPVLVCANHLNMFDSIFLHYALATVPEYMREFRLFTWNVPAVENFKRDTFLAALTYLSKTIPIDRGGGPAHYRAILDRIKFLTARGEIFTIFPEGGRSRTGRVEVERVTSGVGNIVRDLVNPIVVCVYMRGETQATYGSLPPRGDRIHVRAEAITPVTKFSGVRATKDLAHQIIVKLRELELQVMPETADAPAPASVSTPAAAGE